MSDVNALAQTLAQKPELLTVIATAMKVIPDFIASLPAINQLIASAKSGTPATLSPAQITAVEEDIADLGKLGHDFGLFAAPKEPTEPPSAEPAAQ